MSFWDMIEEGSSLSPRELELRDKFVKEYLFDFDEVAAAKRVGFLPGLAEDCAKRLMEEPYVQRKLAQLQGEGARDEEEEYAETRRRIRMGLLRESQFRGSGASHAARVSALSKLATIYEMDPKDNKALDINLGGVMVVPGMASVEDWEKAARSSQTKLQQDTLD